MRYQEYKKKMEKISKVLNVLYRFRFPIGGTILVIIAGSLTLTGLSGKAQNVILENTELVYGQSVTAYGKSIFGDAEVQYSKVGEDNWTTDIPYRAGAYKARGVSKNGFGAITYTDTVDFTIAPKPLNVALSVTTITYGDSISYTSDVLTSRGDKIESITFSYGEEYDQVDPFGENDNFDTTVKYDASSLRILDVNNEDVTYCYDLNVSDLAIKIKKRNLKLVTTATKKEYDGSPLTNENYYVADETPLAQGDQITSMTATSITEIGSATMGTELVIKNGEKDRTKFYKVQWDAPGTLTIEKHKLRINTNSITRPYNGHMLSADAENSDDKLEYTESGLLTELGHEIKNVVFTSQGTYKPVSGSPNAIESYDIVNGNGESVKDYYDIEMTEGVINITAVPLVVTYDEKEKLYDFTTDPLVGDLSYTGLVDNDEFHYTIDGTNSTSNISENPYQFTCTDVSVYNNTLSLDVTDCYSISYTNDHGYVQIKALPLVLTSNSITTTYDGNVFSKDSLLDDRQLTLSSTGLQEGHTVVYDFNYEGEMMVNGSNTFNYSVIDNDTSQDVTALYKVETIYGQITTNKRDLNVVFDSGTWTYDGASHLADHYEATGLAEGDTIEFTSDYPSVMDYTANPISNSREFYISRGGSPVSGYYNINTTFGQLKVNKQEITIDFTAPESKMYDAEPIPVNAGDVNISGLDTTQFAYDLYLNYYNIERYQDNGYDIKITDLQIYRIDDIYRENPLTNNFSFKFNNNTVNPADLTIGHVDISKRPLHISSKTLEKVYDGIPLTSESDGVAFLYEESDLLSAKGHYIAFEYGSEQTLVGTTTNTISVRVYDSESNDVTDCYDMSGVNTTLGQLTVTENDSLVITFPNIVSKTYNGANQLPDRSFTSENLAMGDEISVSYKASFLNAGEYSLEECFNIGINRGGVDVLYCYKDITLIGVPFVINKYDMHIEMYDINRGLDSSNFPDANYNCTHTTVPSTDTLNLVYPENALELVEEGIYPTPTYTIVNKTDGSDRLSNYNVYLTDGNAILTLIDLNVNIVDRYLGYIGEPITYDGSDFWTYDQVLLSNYNCYITGLQCEVDGELKDPGEYDVRGINTDQIKIMRYGSYGNPDEDVTAYFNLIFTNLTATAYVSKRTIEINLLDYTHTYDGREVYTGFWTDGLASPEHHIEIVNAYAQSITHPGTVTNIIEDASQVVVKDAQGNDVTYLYNIVVDSSVLGQTITTTVNKCELSISTPTYEKSFNGQPFNIDNFNGLRNVYIEYDYDGYFGHGRSSSPYLVYQYDVNADCYTELMTGDTIFFKYPVFTNYHAQNVQNEVDYQVLNEDGEDVTDCYNVTTNFGTLTINRLEYNYTGGTNNKTYDGNSYTTTDYLTKKDADFVKFGTSNPSNMPPDLPEELVDYLEDHKNDLYAYFAPGETDFMTGTYTLYPTFVFMYDGVDLVASGDILFTGGTVSSTIYKRTVTINNIPNQVAYIDGQRYTQASEEIEVSGLATGDKLYVGEELFDEDEGKEDWIAIPNMTEIKTYSPEEVATYINASQIHIYRTVNGVRYDVTDCYNIQFIYHEIRVINS